MPDEKDTSKPNTKLAESKVEATDPKIDPLKVDPRTPAKPPDLPPEPPKVPTAKQLEVLQCCAREHLTVVAEGGRRIWKIFVRRGDTVGWERVDSDVVERAVKNGWLDITKKPVLTEEGLALV